MTQTQFIKRLERAEKALDLLERRRAFFASNDRKVDFSRLTRVEMGCIDIFFRNTGLDASRLAEIHKLALDEIFEKAAGIRDDIDMEIDFMVNEAGKRHFTLKRPRDSASAPWEKTVPHRYGRYLALLEKAVRSDPAFQSSAARGQPVDKYKMLRAARALFRLEPGPGERHKKK